MGRQEKPLEYLRQFIPEAAVPRVLQYLHHYRVHLTITRERKTVLGDYRHATPEATHRISVNSSLNKYAFLITLIHELAHLVTFTEYGHRVAPHGREWKNHYAVLLSDFIQMPVFPQDVLQALQESLHDLPASSCSDENLMRILRSYDSHIHDRVLVEALPEGAHFEIDGGKVFQKGKRLRKRYQCVEVATGRLYLFSPIFEVKASSS